MVKSEEILEILAETGNKDDVPAKKNKYSRTQLLSAALYGIEELHSECVELLSKHSPFKKVKPNPQ